MRREIKNVADCPVAAALVAPVPIDSRTSVYARAGDWLPSGCAVVACLGLLLSFRRPKTS